MKRLRDTLFRPVLRVCLIVWMLLVLFVHFILNDTFVHKHPRLGRLHIKASKLVTAKSVYE